MFNEFFLILKTFVTVIAVENLQSFVFLLNMQIITVGEAEYFIAKITFVIFFLMFEVGMRIQNPLLRKQFMTKSALKALGYVFVNFYFGFQVQHLFFF